MGHVAFYTFGILRAQRGDEQVQGFYDRVEAAVAAAAATPGHLATYLGVIDATQFGPRFFVPGVHARAPQTLSLWTDLASVHKFAYSDPHAEALRLRRVLNISTTVDPHRMLSTSARHSISTVCRPGCPRHQEPSSDDGHRGIGTLAWSRWARFCGSDQQSVSAGSGTGEAARSLPPKLTDRSSQLRSRLP
jgi:hypothetical protein